MGNPLRPRAALPGWAVLLTVAAVLPVASANGAERRTHALPPQLAGTWTRTVTKADITRAHVVPAEVDHAYPGLVVLLTIKKNGATVLSAKERTGAYSWPGSLTPVGADRIHVRGIPLDVANVYRWRVSGRLLTLTKISDTEITGMRTAWLTGVWKRK